MTTKERTEVLGCIKGLLAISKIAMPDTYYLTDKRVRRAQRLIINLKKDPGVRVS